MPLSRAVSFALATLLVASLTWLALGARHRIVHLAPAPVGVVLSEVVRPPQPAAPPPAPASDTGAVAAADSAPPQNDPMSELAPAVEPPTIMDPEWISRPASPERFYPRAAFLAGIEGRVELACFVETDGLLTCEIASEQPPGHGFGAAALEIARGHIMRPAERDGAPVRARFRMVVPFSSG